MRLTKKMIDETGYWYESDKHLTDKLGQFEDIEEKHNIKSVDDLDNKLKALEILKEYLTIDVKERKLKFKGNLSAIIFCELKAFGGNPDYDLLKEVLL